MTSDTEKELRKIRKHVGEIERRTERLFKYGDGDIYALWQYARGVKEEISALIKSEGRSPK